MGCMNILFGTIVFGVLLGETVGRKETIGDVFESTAIKQTGCLGVFLLEQMVLEESAVYTFDVRIMQLLPVTFQIWRPVDKDIKLYKLVGQKRFEPHVAPSIYSVSLFPESYILAKNGDVVGMYNEQDTCAVAYQFAPDPANPLYHYSVTNPEGMEPGVMVRFTDISLPYKFAISASYDTEWEPYFTPFTGILTSPQTPVTFTTIPPIPPNEGTFIYTGNPLNGRSSISFQGARGIFLLPHVILPDAVIVRFYAHVVRADNVWFQVWRPGKNEGEFILVGQKMFKVEQAPSTSVVELVAGEYIFTKQGDVLGFMIESDSSVIGYNFLTNPSESGPYAASLPAEGVDIWSLIRFNTNKMPYDYAVGVMCDTVVDGNIYGTPNTQPPPTPSTTSKPPTTVPAKTLPSILPSNSPSTMIGHDYLTYADKFLSVGSRRTFLLPELCFQEYGIVSSFLGFFTNAGTIQFLVCRPIPNTAAGLYKVVGTANYRSEESMVLGRAELHETDRISVEPGDCLGFTNLDGVGLIGYQFEQVRLYSSDLVAFQQNDVVTFDELPLPYKFSIGAVYDRTDRPTTLSYVPTSTPPSTVSTTQEPTTPLNTALPSLLPDSSTSLVIGQQFLQYTDKFIALGARRTFLLPDLKFTEYGEVNTFLAFIVNPGDIQFQVWRPVPGQKNAYQVVGLVNYRAVEAMKLGRAELSSVIDVLRVEPGDCVGFSTFDDRGLIGYSFEQTNLYATENAEFLKGDVIQYDDQLLMPYKFSMAVIYDKTDPPTTTIISTTTTTTRTTTLATPTETYTTSRSPSTTSVPPTPSSTSRTTQTYTKYATSSPHSPTTSPLSVTQISTAHSTSVSPTSTPSQPPITSTIVLSTTIKTTQSPSLTPSTNTVSRSTLPPSTSSISLTPSSLTSTALSSSPSSLASVASSNAPPSSSSTIDTTKGNSTLTTTSTEGTRPSSAVSSSQPDHQTTEDITPKTLASTSDGPYFWLQDPNFMLALLIWLVILTVLFIVMSCYLICRKRNKNKLNRNKSTKSNSYLYAYPTKGLADTNNPKRVPSAYERWGGIKEEDSIDYFNPQIGVPQVARCESMKQPFNADFEAHQDTLRRNGPNSGTAPIIDSNFSLSRSGTNRSTAPLIDSSSSLSRTGTNRSTAPLIDLDSVTGSSTQM